MIAKLREGKGFGRPLADTGLYPAARDADDPRRRGERAARGNAGARRRRLRPRGGRSAIKRFLAVLEPVLILGLAVMVGGIVFSILLGVMGMSELVV